MFSYLQVMMQFLFVPDFHSSPAQIKINESLHRNLLDKLYWKLDDVSGAVQHSITDYNFGQSNNIPILVLLYE